MKAYEGLKTTFNPTKFDPGKWAAAAADAGMRYVVFTTKHHDGFSMFDTHQTDYKVTSLETPFHTNPRADVTKAVFDAFRQKGLGVGAYFSKPDWHSDDYWWRRFATPDRNVNYDPAKYPERWQQYKDFTYNQIEELMTGYGPIDILWLDGGWVRPNAAGRPAWAKSPYDQDVDMPRIASMARRHQPGIIVVDRAVPGPYENYRTPEQEVPEKPLDYPWETCMTMATSWSYVPNDTYKPAGRLIHLLVDVVSKGGNFLLNIGPGPDGEWHAAAYDRLREIGAWMKVNGEAIYGSKPIAPYAKSAIRYTQSKDGRTVFAVYLAGDAEVRPPAEITIEGVRPKTGGTIRLLGASNVALPWRLTGDSIIVLVPESIRSNPPCQHAWVLRFETR